VFGASVIATAVSWFTHVVPSLEVRTAYNSLPLPSTYTRDSKVPASFVVKAQPKSGSISSVV
jgi:hypothetical protein